MEGNRKMLGIEKKTCMWMSLGICLLCGIFLYNTAAFKYLIDVNGYNGDNLVVYYNENGEYSEAQKLKADKVQVTDINSGKVIERTNNTFQFSVPLKEIKNLKEFRVDFYQPKDTKIQIEKMRAKLGKIPLISLMGNEMISYEKYTYGLNVISNENEFVFVIEGEIPLVSFDGFTEEVINRSLIVIGTVLLLFLYFVIFSINNKVINLLYFRIIDFIKNFLGNKIFKVIIENRKAGKVVTTIFPLVLFFPILWQNRAVLFNLSLIETQIEMKQRIFIAIAGITIGVLTYFYFYMNLQIEEEKKEKFKKRIPGMALLVGVIIGLLAMFIYGYNISGNGNYHNDEHYHLYSAIGFLKTGRMVEWDCVNNCAGNAYTRGWPLTLMVAGVFKIFGESVAAARMLSVICGIIFVLEVYILLYRYKHDIKQALFVTLMVGFQPNIIEVFRTVRMYSVMLPISTFLVFCMYKTIFSQPLCNSKSKVMRFIESNVNFHYGYAVLTAICAMLLWLLMPNALFLGFGFAVFVVFMAYKTKERKLIIISGIIPILIILLLTVKLKPDLFPAVLQEMVHALSFHSSNGVGGVHEEYFWQLVNYPLGLFGGIIVFTIGAVKIIRSKDVMEKGLLVICAVTVFLFAIVFKHYYQVRYMIFLAPIATYIIAKGLLHVIHFSSKKSGKLVVLITILYICTNILFASDYLYNSENEFADFKSAYKKLYETVQKDEIALFSYHYRSLYLTQFSKVDFYEYEDTETDLKDFGRFAAANPRGVVSVETEKFYYQSNAMREFLNNWIDKVGGTGIDNNFVELYISNFYEGGRLEYADTARYERQEDKMVIELPYADFMEQGLFGALKLEKENEVKHIQFSIPEGFSEQESIILRVPVDEDFSISDEVAVCTVGNMLTVESIEWDDGEENLSKETGGI